MATSDDLDQLIFVECLRNAVQYGGKANTKAIMGKILGQRADLRPRAREVGILVDKTVRRVNSMSLEEQRSELEVLSPESLSKKKSVPEERVLPPLPNLPMGGKVVMRLAPYPSGALHIGNARMIVLNDHYVKRYGGKLILAFDDTIGAPKSKLDSPGAKFVIPEAYDLIREGLEWLGVDWHEEIYKSDRLELYYGHCEQLIKSGQAYICTCDARTFKESYKDKGVACPHRNRSVTENLEHWEKMLEGSYPEMAAVVRLKTGMDQPDPAVRDQIIMRISEAPHPRVGTRYRVWPMLEFSWGVDDHELGVTHIIRGADLVKEDFIEDFLWEYFGWPKAEFLHYGRMRFEHMNLSKTRARENIQKGVYRGWDDPRTWSLQSLKARGIRPEALRDMLLDLGLSMTPIKVSPDALYAKNQKIIDPISPRYFYVEDPVPITVSGTPEGNYLAKPLLLPPDESKGFREILVEPREGKVALFVSRRDAEKVVGREGIRLKDLFNVTINGSSTGGMEATFHSVKMDRALNFPIIQWVPKSPNVPCRILKPDGQISEGLAEKSIDDIHEGQVVQFERYGFVRLVDSSATPKEFYFTH
ncbi:MAG: glutamate--tRNA ligase [Promethearchaeota archaeon]